MHWSSSTQCPRDDTLTGINQAMSRSDDPGFSLIEVIVSVGLLAVVSLGVAELFAAATDATVSAKEQTTTAILAGQKMEQLRGLAWGFEPGSGLPVSDTTTDLTLDPPHPVGQACALRRLAYSTPTRRGTSTTWMHKGTG